MAKCSFTLPSSPVHLHSFCGQYTINWSSCLLKYLSITAFNGLSLHSGHSSRCFFTFWTHPSQKCPPQHVVRNGSCKTDKHTGQLKSLEGCVIKLNCCSILIQLKTPSNVDTCPRVTCKYLAARYLE